MNLANKKCVPCEGGVCPLQGSATAPFKKELHASWKIVNDHHLEREFTFPDFKQALAFTNEVGALAEAEGHHPDLHLSWGKVRIILWTHAINGLSENDFVLAAKIDGLLP